MENTETITRLYALEVEITSTGIIYIEATDEGNACEIAGELIESGRGDWKEDPEPRTTIRSATDETDMLNKPDWAPEREKAEQNRLAYLELIEERGED